ncbi:hypothetical protein RT43_GL001098 [Enterococcus italicus DSM 15952]|nr:hypothetical protein RT43_GL001098 [Enterococcus italicus DSM 15952]
MLSIFQNYFIHQFFWGTISTFHRFLLKKILIRSILFYL